MIAALFEARKNLTRWLRSLSVSPVVQCQMRDTSIIECTLYLYCRHLHQQHDGRPSAQSLLMFL